MIRYLTLLAPALLLAPPAAAEEDIQGWTAVTATIPVNDKLLVWLEAQGRFPDDVSRLGQLLLRPAIGYKVSPAATIFAGYAYARTTSASGTFTHEHRLWQQALWRAIGDGKSLTLTGRSRLEQRFVQGTGDVGVRFRQMLRLTAPIDDSGAQVVGWTEAFLGLNDTQAGQRSGFDRMRNFAGVSLPINDKVRLEPGYMNEYVSLRGADDRVNHIASVTVNLNF